MSDEGCTGQDAAPPGERHLLFREKYDVLSKEASQRVSAHPTASASPHSNRHRLLSGNLDAGHDETDDVRQQQPSDLQMWVCLLSCCSGLSRASSWADTRTADARFSMTTSTQKSACRRSAGGTGTTRASSWWAQTQNRSRWLCTSHPGPTCKCQCCRPPRRRCRPAATLCPSVSCQRRARWSASTARPAPACCCSSWLTVCGWRACCSASASACWGSTSLCEPRYPACTAFQVRAMKLVHTWCEALQDVRHLNGPKIQFVQFWFVCRNVLQHCDGSEHSLIMSDIKDKVTKQVLTLITSGVCFTFLGSSRRVELVASGERDIRFSFTDFTALPLSELLKCTCETSRRIYSVNTVSGLIGGGQIRCVLVLYVSSLWCLSVTWCKHMDHLTRSLLSVVEVRSRFLSFLWCIFEYIYCWLSVPNVCEGFCQIVEAFPMNCT